MRSRGCRRRVSVSFTSPLASTSRVGLGLAKLSARRATRGATAALPEPLPPEPSPLFLLHAHELEATTARWSGESLTSPSPRAGRRSRGDKHTCLIELACLLDVGALQQTC